MTVDPVRPPSHYIDDALRVNGVSDAFLVELETNMCIASASNRARNAEETVAWAAMAMVAVTRAMGQLAVRADVREIELGTADRTYCLHRLGSHTNIVLCAVLDSPYHQSPSSRRAIGEVARATTGVAFKPAPAPVARGPLGIAPMIPPVITPIPGPSPSPMPPPLPRRNKP